MGDVEGGSGVPQLRVTSYNNAPRAKSIETQLIYDNAPSLGLVHTHAFAFIKAYMYLNLCC